MPWKETNAMNEKVKFISAWLTNEYTMTDLCKQFNISRETGYKIVNRYKVEGIRGLEEHSRAHYRHPAQTEENSIDMILKSKLRYPKWGPRKLKAWLEDAYKEHKWPAASTIGEILKRNGMVSVKKSRAKIQPYTDPFILCNEPNAVWSADFKGQFKLGSNEMCYPLTISDNYSRYLLCCDCFGRPTLDNVKHSFENIFRKNGLPKAIKTDNGTPFSTVGIAGLSKLSIWWLKLGIMPERIKPGHPEQNGRHERMHRTLKEATALPPKETMRSQQLAMHKFMKEYNNERPHEALGNLKPANIYNASRNEYPNKLPEVEYDTNMIVKKVKHNGEIKIKSNCYYVGTVLTGESVGLKDMDGELHLYFSKLKIGIVDQKKLIIRRIA